MEKVLTIRKGDDNYITFHDLDLDYELEIEIENSDEAISTYLNKDGLISLRKHLDYILKKLDKL